MEYSERMHELSMRQRDKITNKKKIFCDKVKNDWRTGLKITKWKFSLGKFGTKVNLISEY